MRHITNSLFFPYSKHRKVRKITGHMKFNKVQKLLQIKEVEKMIAVPYLTSVSDIDSSTSLF